MEVQERARTNNTKCKGELLAVPIGPLFNAGVPLETLAVTLVHCLYEDGSLIKISKNLYATKKMDKKHIKCSYYNSCNIRNHCNQGGKKPISVILTWFIVLYLLNYIVECTSNGYFKLKHQIVLQIEYCFILLHYTMHSQ